MGRPWADRGQEGARHLHGGYDTNDVLPLGHIILKRYLPFWLLGLVPVGGCIVSVIDAIFILEA